MQKSTKSLTAVTAAGAIAMLALVGCSSDPEGDPAGDHGGPAQQSNVYDFKTPSHAAEGEVTIQFPDELREAAGGEAENLLVSSVKATPHELDSAKYCAVDLAIKYSNGAPEALVGETTKETDWKHKYSSEEKARILKAMEEGNGGYDDIIAESGAEDPERLRMYLDAERVEFETTVPGWQDLLKTLTHNRGRAISELDTSDPETGQYLSEDHKTVTTVRSCAKSPMDDENATSFVFPTSDGDSTSKFATFDVTAMANGTVAVTNGEVEDYTRDSNGDWIAG